MAFSYTDLDSISDYELQRSPAAALQRQVDGVVQSGWVSVRNRLFAAASTGFGKGVLILGGLILAGAAVYAGMTGAAGMAVPGDIMAIVPLGEQMSFAQGAMAGLNYATNFLFSYGGMLTLAVGGAVGSTMDIISAQGAISAEQAQAKLREKKLLAEVSALRERLGEVGTERAVEELTTPAQFAKAEQARRARGGRQEGMER